MRNVAIIGTGQTKHGRLRNVNTAEMVAEACWKAMEDANLTPDEIDAIVVGNMQGFGGIYDAELWAGELFGAQKPFLRITTGGTTGGSVAHGGYYAVASGMHDKVLAVAWEKHSDSKERGATTGLAHVALANMFHDLQHGASIKWLVAIATGAAIGVSAFQATCYMHRSGCKVEHFDMVAAKSRRNAVKNEYAHLRWPNCTPDDIAKTEWVSWPLRFGHVCPASDGASAIVIATEEIAKKAEKPAWIRGVAAYADEANWLGENAQGTAICDLSEQLQCVITAREAYRRAGIRDPKKEIDVAEIYQPFPNQELMFAEKLGLFDEGKAWVALEEGEMEIDGKMPTDPSGGVLSTNAIGSSAMQRPLECALQIMGKAGRHQVPKDVKIAVAHGWGGSVNFSTVTVLGDTPKR